MKTKIIIYIALLMLFTIDISAQLTELSIDNDVIKFKVDLTRGGAINFLSQSSNNRNLVNIHDEGRYIQQSYYAGNSVDRRSEGQSSSWSPWPWNPIQVGDAFGNRAEILEYKQNGDTIYVKSIPMLWDMNNEPAEATIEQWTILKDNVLEVHNRLTCFRTNLIYGGNVFRDQELPALYPISALKNLYSYIGNAPFTNDVLSKIPIVNLSSGFWGIYNEVNENWMAFVDNDLNGIGVYNPKTKNFLAGMYGNPGYESNDASTSYIAPIKKEYLSKNSIYDYTYYVIVGDLEDIRATIYELRGPILVPPSAPILISPENNIELSDTATNITFIWNSVDLAESYSIEAGQTIDSLIISVNNILDTSYIHHNELLSGKLYWRVNAKNQDGVGVWSEVFAINVTLTGNRNFNNNFPAEFVINQNYPNPFNPSTMIKYGLPEKSNVKLEIFNLLGQSVETLVNTEKSAGFYETAWHAENLPSGIYLISIRAEGVSSKKSFTQVKKALLLK